MAWPPPAPRASSSPLHPYLPPQQRIHHQAKLGSKICLARGRGRRMRPDHKQATSRQRGQVLTDQWPQAAADPVPHHRDSHCPAHHEPGPRRYVLVTGRHEQVPGQQLPAGPPAMADRQREITPPPHPGRCRKHQRLRARPGQTLTRARPLRRRAARIARPALVRMRSRKPCVFARRRLFGWNVRLLTGDSRLGAAYCPARRPCAHEGTAKPPWVPGCVHVTRPVTAGQTSAGTGRRNSRLPNVHPARRLGCGQPIRQHTSSHISDHEPCSRRHGPFAHEMRCGVHSLWKRLLITSGGARWPRDKRHGSGGGLGEIAGRAL